MAHKNTHRAPLRPLDARTLALTTGGLGFLRPAPGTWGSMPPVVLAGLLLWLGQAAGVVMVVTLSVLFASSMACVAFGAFAETRFGLKDAPEVVADETAGVCLPVLVAIYVEPTGNGQWLALALAFGLFRLFDITKPWPMRRLERLKAGWGVLLDDLAAGVYAAVLLVLMLRFWPFGG